MRCKIFKFSLIFTCIFLNLFTELSFSKSSDEVIDAANISLEEFILKIRDNGIPESRTYLLEKTIKQEADFCFKCFVEKVTQQGKINKKGICEVIIASKTCKSVENKSDLMDCDNLNETTSFDPYSLLAGCSIGLFNSMKELMSFLWNVVKGTFEVAKHPIETAGEAKEYLESVRLYLVSEYDKAYDEADWPLRDMKAGLAVSGIVAGKLVKAITDYLDKEYAEYGCLNYQARTETLCKVASDFILPPAAALSLFKYGGNITKIKDIDKILKKPFNVTDRSHLAKISLKRNISRKQQKALEKSHHFGKGQKGLNGETAGIGNYTLSQLKEKNRILKEAGFSKLEIRKLMEDGVVGVSSNGFSKFHSKKIGDKVSVYSRNQGGIILDKNTIGLKRMQNSNQGKTPSTKGKTPVSKEATERIKERELPDLTRETPTAKKGIPNLKIGDETFVYSQTFGKNVKAKITGITANGAKVKVEYPFDDGSTRRRWVPVNKLQMN